MEEFTNSEYVETIENILITICDGLSVQDLVSMTGITEEYAEDILKFTGELSQED